MKICYDCKWIQLEVNKHTDEDFSKCLAPQNQVLDVVTGKTKLRYQYCETLRGKGSGSQDREDLCGPMGMWFEPKEEGNEGSR